MDVKQMLEEWVESFRSRAPKDLTLALQIDIQPGRRSWHVIVEPGGQVTLGDGPSPRAQVILATTGETLQRIYLGQVTALTAAGKAHASDPAPLEWLLGEGQRFTPQLYQDALLFLQRFFNRCDPERILLGEAHSRVVHGAHAIPLYYHSGFRSAWYLVKKGEQLNEPGDINAYHQAFVFVSGKGWAKIGDRTVQVSGGEAYYIPPNSDHIVWVEDDRPLVLIYLAWGEGA